MAIHTPVQRLFYSSCGEVDREAGVTIRITRQMRIMVDIIRIARNGYPNFDLYFQAIESRITFPILLRVGRLRTQMFVMPYSAEYRTEYKVPEFTLRGNYLLIEVYVETDWDRYKDQASPCVPSAAGPGPQFESCGYNQFIGTAGNMSTSSSHQPVVKQEMDSSPHTESPHDASNEWKTWSQSSVKTETTTVVKKEDNEPSAESVVKREADAVARPSTTPSVVVKTQKSETTTSDEPPEMPPENGLKFQIKWKMSESRGRSPVFRLSENLSGWPDVYVIHIPDNQVGCGKMLLMTDDPLPVPNPFQFKAGDNRRRSEMGGQLSLCPDCADITGRLNNNRVHSYSLSVQNSDDFRVHGIQYWNQIFEVTCQLDDFVFHLRADSLRPVSPSY